ncbi:MAG: hypothetical protein ACE5H3_06770, partial [Planctomycetota bacterium]
PVGAALFCGLLLGGAIGRACLRAGFSDPPGGRKGHGRPVPMGGFLFVLPLWGQVQALGGGLLFAAGGIVLAVGLWEDLLKTRRRELAWGFRLSILGAAAWLGAGDAALGDPSAGPRIFPALLLLAAAIAFNWFDHADGLAAGAGLGALAGLLQAGDTRTAIAAGLLAAFLIQNAFLPGGARLFLGDAGAQLLGFSLACAALLAPRAGPAGAGSLLLGGAAIALPLVDGMRVAGARLAAGLPPWRADRRRHLGHLGWARGLPRGLLAVLCAALAFGFVQAGLRLS